MGLEIGDQFGNGIDRQFLADDNQKVQADCTSSEIGWKSCSGIVGEL